MFKRELLWLVADVHWVLGHALAWDRGAIVTISVRVGSLSSWNLLVVHLTSIYKGLKFIVLALDHLSHCLVKEVLGLVSPSWFVAQASIP